MLLEQRQIAVKQSALNHGVEIVVAEPVAAQECGKSDDESCNTDKAEHD